MSRPVLSAIVSCFFAAFVNGSLEVAQNSSQSEDHQLTGTRLLADQIGIIGSGGTKVNNDIFSLLLQSMNISTTSTASPDFGNNRQLQRQLRRLPWNDDNMDETMTDGTGTIADNANDGNDDDDSTSPVSIFTSDEIGWSNINEQVDMVTPMVLAHLQKLGLEHLHLPDMRESLSVRPLFITYSAELLLNNGLVYHLTGIERTGNALMTYSDKSFVCRFYLLIKYLQFDYDFLIKLMAFEGYGGKVYGSLDDTVIYADLYINVEATRLRLNDFRIIKFRNIQVQLSQRRFIQELSGVILSPITNLFRDRITTSISDGLKDQMQGVMDDFNNKDPLELRTFAKQMLAGLMGQR